MARHGDSGESDQHALQATFTPFRARFDSGEQFEEVIGLFMASGRQAAVRRMLHVSGMGTKEIFGLFDEMDRAAKAS